MVRKPGPKHQMAVAVDMVVLSLRDGRLHVALIERAAPTLRSWWALPGGFVLQGESLEDAAYRELSEEAGIGRGSVVLEQLATYGAPDRDPRGRVIAVAWVVLGANLPDLTAGSDAARARWWPVEEIDHLELAFDHPDILRAGLERARAKLEYTTIATAFLGGTFTMSQLRGVYEAVWGQRLEAGNFHRKVLQVDGFIRSTGEYTHGRGRPAAILVAGPATVIQPPILRATN